MSATLVIESSTPTASIARIDASGIAHRQFQSDRSHNSLLFAPLAELLDPATRSSLDAVLVGSGPGSYSGTRVGIAAAQGVGLVLSCPVIAVPSILAVPSAADGATCLAIGDARRGSFWTSLMRDSRFVHEPRLCDEAALASEVAAAHAQGIPVIAFEDAEHFPAAVRDLVRKEAPDATRLWQVWQNWDKALRNQARQAIAQPIYLKPPHITMAKRQPLL
ncbi:MAG TPA: tRNA (adenosine(37)-N6)-threonylcarbamoyltransferase complex dimerization subunit type 1 TsaB [Luteolibacter sp.]|nr:tRNA (adenosine(37)-N6)-threonylcarbamoyltransferase complex dimerization subunit type 1 TsaB [Luteolibacter sp.]